MATISNTPRPGYAWDATDNCWYPIGVGGHSHNEIAKSIVTTKGDLIVGTGSGTVVRQGVGADGSVLIADSSQADGVNWAGTMQYAGKNKIINGDFSVWQRGTSFSNPASGAFTTDRWSVVWDGSGATRTVSQQVFTAGNAITGYEPVNFLRFNQSVAGTGGSYNLIQNRIEDVRTFAGQTVTVSFWAKAASSITLPQLNWEQGYGTGGSPSATTDVNFATNIAITTSWARYTYTVTVPSISGKTIGTTTPGYLGLRLWMPINTAFTLDIWGVQVEAGSVATPFVPAGGGNQQAELALCQRYYERINLPTGNTQNFGLGTPPGGNVFDITYNFKVEKRFPSQVLDYANVAVYVTGFGTYSGGTIASASANTMAQCVRYTHTSSPWTGTQVGWMFGNTSGAYLGFSAEL